MNTPPPGNLDYADPAIVKKFLSCPKVKPKNDENAFRLIEASHNKIRKFQKNQKPGS